MKLGFAQIGVSGCRSHGVAPVRKGVGRGATEEVARATKELRLNSTFLVYFAPFLAHFPPIFQNFFAPGVTISRGCAGIAQNEISKRGDSAGSRGCGSPQKLVSQ